MGKLDFSTNQSVMIIRTKNLPCHHPEDSYELTRALLNTAYDCQIVLSIKSIIQRLMLARELEVALPNPDSPTLSLTENVHKALKV